MFDISGGFSLTHPGEIIKHFILFLFSLLYIWHLSYQIVMKRSIRYC